MSIYLEFPAIEDYPVYIPLEHITAIIPDWLAKLVQSSPPNVDILNTGEIVSAIELSD